jgi:hypothetical protein
MNGDCWCRTHHISFLFHSVGFLQNEWASRVESTPRRFCVAFLKYHAVVIVIRIFEHIASKFVTNETLDTLTMNTFDCAQRTALTEKRGSLFFSMMTTCVQANAISFFADYSVHQLILAYGYYVYIKEQRKRLKEGRNSSNADFKLGALAGSFLRNSSLLATSRVLSLSASSLGGAVGSMVWPGWGTLVGSNIGDSLSISLIDDVKSPALV